MFSTIAFILVSAVILVSSFRRVPGFGVFAALIIIGTTVWWRGDTLAGLGLVPPENWMATIGWSLLWGIVLALASTLLDSTFSAPRSATSRSSIVHLTS